MLDAEVREIFQSSGEGIDGEFDAEHSQYIFRANAGKSTLDKWRLMVGDIATNLRASLDHIAYQLALQTSKRRHDTYFPLLQKRNDRIFIKRTIHFNPEIRKKMEGFQPYHATEPRSHPLWVVSKLANIDKHRCINILPIMIGIGEVNIPADGNFDLSFNDTNISAVVTGSFNLQEEFKPRITFEPQIEITEPDKVFHYNFGYLHNAYELIIYEIIPTFFSVSFETKEEN